MKRALSIRICSRQVPRHTTSSEIEGYCHSSPNGLSGWSLGALAQAGSRPGLAPACYIATRMRELGPGSEV